MIKPRQTAPVKNDGPVESLVFELTGELTIHRVAQIKADLLGALERNADLEIDLSGISDLDVAGMQLLLLAKRTAEVDGRGLRLTGHSTVVHDVFKRVSMAAHFSDPVTPVAMVDTSA